MNSSDSYIAAEKRATFSSIATNIKLDRMHPPPTTSLLFERAQCQKSHTTQISSHAKEIRLAKYHRDTTPRRLVESGAVRLQMQTNPRKGGTNSDRLIDSGAVRLTCHTTPRRLYAIRGKICSPPPSSSFKRMAPLRGNERIVLATGRYLATATTPSKKSNAHISGHRFRAAMSRHNARHLSYVM
jgi:hypothetical protein